MKTINKEKLAQNMIASILLAIAYAAGTYAIYDGLMGKLNNTPTVNFVNYFWMVLAVIGLALVVFTLIKRHSALFWYSLSLLVYGILIKVLEYGLLSAPIPGIGKYIFYAMEGLAVLYVILMFTYTLVKITR